MGQKVNPISMRLGYIQGWESNWIATKKDFATNLRIDHAIRQYLHKNTPPAIIAKSLIERTLNIITLTIYTPKPGLLIGPGGTRVAELTKALKKIAKKDIQLNVYEVKQPALDASLVAQSIAHQISSRAPYRRSIKQALAAAMRIGAQGVKIQVGGRIMGVEIARREEYKEGRIPLHTLRADISYGTAFAQTTYGKIGIKVWIFSKQVYGKRDLSLNLAIIDPKKHGAASRIKREPFSRKK